MGSAPLTATPPAAVHPTLTEPYETPFHPPSTAVCIAPSPGQSQGPRWPLLLPRAQPMFEHSIPPFRVPWGLTPVAAPIDSQASAAPWGSLLAQPSGALCAQTNRTPGLSPLLASGPPPAAGPPAPPSPRCAHRALPRGDSGQSRRPGGDNTPQWEGLGEAAVLPESRGGVPAPASANGRPHSLVSSGAPSDPAVPRRPVPLPAWPWSQLPLTTRGPQTLLRIGGVYTCVWRAT